MKFRVPALPLPPRFRHRPRRLRRLPVREQSAAPPRLPRPRLAAAPAAWPGTAVSLHVRDGGCGPVWHHALAGVVAWPERRLPARLAWPPWLEEPRPKVQAWRLQPRARPLARALRPRLAAPGCRRSPLRPVRARGRPGPERLAAKEPGRAVGQPAPLFLAFYAASCGHASTCAYGAYNILTMPSARTKQVPLFRGPGLGEDGPQFRPVGGLTPDFLALFSTAIAGQFGWVPRRQWVNLKEGCPRCAFRR